MSDGDRVYRARIRCNATGEVREYADAADWHMFGDDWRDALVFHWSEGNSACDCNRGRFFAVAGGEDPPELDCWPEDRYTVLDITCPNGEVIPIDVEAEA